MFLLFIHTISTLASAAEVKYYYRADKVAFWNKFLPSLHNAGTNPSKNIKLYNNIGRDSKIPEEHHLLPDHFNAQEYWGRPRPYMEYANYPFPPPPSPPPAPTTFTPTPKPGIRYCKQ